MKIDHPDFYSPTVGDVVEFLSRLDKSIPFRIEDPDTSWEISRIKVYEEDGKIWLTGEYGEMAASDELA